MTYLAFYLNMYTYLDFYSEGTERRREVNLLQLISKNSLINTCDGHSFNYSGMVLQDADNPGQSHPSIRINDAVKFKLDFFDVLYKLVYTCYAQYSQLVYSWYRIGMVLSTCFQDTYVALQVV